MFRALTKPVNSITGVMGADSVTGASVYINGANAAGHAIFTVPTSAGTALLATYKVYLDPTIYNDPYNGVRNVIASGMVVQAINGALEFECDREHLTGDFSSTAQGAYLGLSNSGLITASGPASGTDKFFRFISYVGDNSSGVLKARMETML